MKRNIITIDESKCSGCGLCANACHEGAIQMVDGVAKLISESYCDGLGNCLPACPTGAITIEEREAAAFDEAAVQAHLGAKAPAAEAPAAPEPLACGCPGTHAHAIERRPTVAAPELRQWPVQIQLVPIGAPYFDGADLLIAADCTAYAHANFHADYMRGRVTLIGCPKLDHADYAAKLAAILQAHEIKSLTVLRMEVPCCGGLVQAAKQAMLTAGVLVPWRVVTIGTDGAVLEG